MRDDGRYVRGKPVVPAPIRARAILGPILGLILAGLLPGLAAAHSEGTEASDPSSPAALLAFGGATRQYAALETGRKPWRTARPVPAPMNHAAHAAHGAQAGPNQPGGQMDHSQHTGQPAQADHSQHAQPVDHSQHTSPAAPLELEVRKPTADVHQGH